ncbi:alcohol dehydrogenase [Fluoribacter dumoffii]|uniref:alcohol dehydrogenase n=1 Tax=Fluoribacter dumoffii TaxID=463 RepID=UPI002243A0DA|nr:alcohol dehydrogenase [Fluoribacter dumoffii]MCW8386193.1 alcohol dehydrogenase [Fluoribacter dumoffii]MCW8419244.1 alcohol dehydrogenase [Fluoribacter dumoffii]MCW8452881.1 alcohol dehydrogenase [Fluoribacter dumoffii]MCW8459869.1 alcohol dehydrogenase [Fluoribacter dumoffii]MCW8483346.1 alcohol dehydrogenase [Fluoribacter dumoffii]
MKKMKAVQVSKSGEWETIQKEMVMPSLNQVRIKVEACGVCHSDAFVKENLWPNLHFPRIPGHEIAGVIDEIGANVTHWKPGQRVGVGWAGARCGYCHPCRHGEFILCEHHQITGLDYDGGYAEYMIAPVEALAAIPDELSFAEAAPLMCAGITTFNALRHSVARAGDLVAIQGIGGLGHLAIQFAHKMGFKTVALSKGADKKDLAEKLGAHIYINTDDKDGALELKKLGGARVILATAPSGKAISPLVDALGNKGELVIVGASSDPIQVISTQLIAANRSIKGWPSGSAIDIEETLQFCALEGIRPMIQEYPLADAAKAYDGMMTNKVRFRAVIRMQ